MKHAETWQDWPVSLIRMFLFPCQPPTLPKKWRAESHDSRRRLWKCFFFFVGKRCSHPFLLDVVSDLHPIPVWLWLLLLYCSPSCCNSNCTCKMGLVNQTLSEGKVNLSTAKWIYWQGGIKLGRIDTAWGWISKFSDIWLTGLLGPIIKALILLLRLRLNRGLSHRSRKALRPIHKFKHLSNCPDCSVTTHMHPTVFLSQGLTMKESFWSTMNRKHSKIMSYVSPATNYETGFRIMKI